MDQERSFTARISEKDRLSNRIRWLLRGGLGKRHLHLQKLSNTEFTDVKCIPTGYVLHEGSPFPSDASEASAGVGGTPAGGFGSGARASES